MRESAPALPGCRWQGGAEDEATANIQDAFREFLVALEGCFNDSEVREVEVAIPDGT